VRGSGPFVVHWYTKDAVEDVGFMVSEKRRPRHEERLFIAVEPQVERWAPDMAQGTVKWFSDDKGYGFITPDEEARTSSCTIRV
jgi:hypothetical protein